MKLKMTIVFALVIPFAAVFAATAVAKEHITNTEVVAEIQDHLYHADVYKNGSVTVQYQNGTATLTGSVDSIGVKDDAGRAASKVDDVESVVNNITVNPGDTGPEGIIRNARRAILTYPFYTVFDNVVLQINGNDLTVKGQVTQPYKKSDIGYFLAHIKGVTELTNDLQVLPVSQYDDQIRLAIARAIYDDPAFINYGNQAHPSIHIIVDNGHVTLDGVVNSEVDRAEAMRDARFAATFFSLTDNLRVEGASPASAK